MIAVEAGVATLMLVAWLVRLRAKRILKAKAEEQLRQQLVVRSGIYRIDGMTGREFEERMAIHFQQEGFRVLQTPASHDYGADLILTDSSGERIAVQLKRYQKAVGIDAVREVLGAVAHYETTKGMVITNSRLTNNARNLARSAKIEVWERDTLFSQMIALQQRVQGGSDNISSVAP